MDWISGVVLSIVVVGGLFIFYRALKEPMDLFFGLIKRGFIWIKEQFQGLGDNTSEYKEVISYG